MLYYLTRAVHLILATYLVLIGIVFVEHAIGATSSHPSHEFTDMALGLVCVAVALRIARERKLPF